MYSCWALRRRWLPHFSLRTGEWALLPGLSISRFIHDSQGPQSWGQQQSFWWQYMSKRTMLWCIVHWDSFQTEICKHLCVRRSCQTLGCFQVVYTCGSLNMLKCFYNSIKLNVVFIYSASVYWTLTMYLEDTRHCLCLLGARISAVETNNWWSDKNNHGRSIEDFGSTSGAHRTQTCIWWVLETGSFQRCQE